MKRCLRLLQIVSRWTLCLLLVGSAVAADIAAPIVLVASDRLNGSPFEQTVVLAVPSEGGEHLGLIANRPITATAGNIGRGSTSKQVAVETVFFGGPVMSDALFAVIRAPAAPSKYSIRLMTGLFLVTDSATIERLIESRSTSARYFTGFLVWHAKQLSEEIRSGIWDIQPADASVLFRANPENLWLEFKQIRRHLVANEPR